MIPLPIYEKSRKENTFTPSSFLKAIRKHPRYPFSTDAVQLKRITTLRWISAVLGCPQMLSQACYHGTARDGDTVNPQFSISRTPEEKREIFRNLQRYMDGKIDTRT